MRHLRGVMGTLALLLLCASGAHPPPPAAAAEIPPPMKYPEYQPAADCRNCHDRIYDEYAGSMHAGALADPVFQAQYRGALLPRLAAEPRLEAEASRCGACHSPVAHLKGKGKSGPLPASADDALAGVVCDYCHRIGAYRGSKPGGGNAMSSPGDRKFGPLKNPSSNWHHVYHELQTKSELCGICHEDANGAGLATQTTYSEWKASGYAARGIQCQDCHMSLRGYLSSDRPVHDSGKAATMTVGSARERDTLYTHRFPGSSVAGQLDGAVTIAIAFDPPAAGPGDAVAVRLEIANRHAGHAVPTGSTDLRLVWLELEAGSPGTPVQLEAPPADSPARFGVAAVDPADARVLGSGVPAGSRLYRTVFLDAEGKQTLSSWDARAVAFDNRIGAEERREERFAFRVPADAVPGLTFRARLLHGRYPAGFAGSLGLPPAVPSVIATAEATLPVAAPGP